MARLRWLWLNCRDGVSRRAGRACDNLIARIAEAEREGWLGEVEGLQISLGGANDKLAQIDHRSTTPTIDLGTPSPRAQPAPSSQDR